MGLPETFNPQRIVLLRALYLGDLLCALPALRALRERFPQAEITLVGLPWAEELVRRLPWLDRFLAFPGYPGISEAPYDDGRTANFFAQARVRAYDLAIQMHGNGTSSNGFVASLGAAYTLGHGANDDERLDIRRPYDPAEHEVVRWLQLMALIGAPSRITRAELPCTPAEAEGVGKLLRALPAGSGPLVGLHPGARDPARRWPIERFVRLGDTLAERIGARIVLTGTTSERTQTAAIRRAMRFPALDLAGETSLGDFAALLARLDLLVTNDTGASHLAAVTGTRSVVLFGPSRPAQWAPLDTTLHYAIDALAFAPNADPRTVLGQLPVAAVLEVCNEMLTRRHEEKLCAG